MAESRTATKTHVVCLTYGRDKFGNSDHPNSVILTYSDVQKYHKRLREKGYKFRFFIAGEYGGDFGRTHWHGLYFWYGDHPEIELDKEQVIQGHWDWGFSHWTEATSEAAAIYACKYLDKDEKGAEMFHRASLKPPLGTQYFEELAQLHVDSGSAPQSLQYDFPEVKRKDGNRKKFMMKGAVADNYLYEYVSRWLEQRPDRHIPYSELVQEWQDKQIKDDPIQEFMTKRERRNYTDVEKAQEQAYKAAWRYKFKDYAKRNGKTIECYYGIGEIECAFTDGTRKKYSELSDYAFPPIARTIGREN